MSRPRCCAYCNTPGVDLSLVCGSCMSSITAASRKAQTGSATTTDPEALRDIVSILTAPAPVPSPSTLTPIPPRASVGGESTAARSTGRRGTAVTTPLASGERRRRVAADNTRPTPGDGADLAAADRRAS